MTVVPHSERFHQIEPSTLPGVHRVPDSRQELSGYESPCDPGVSAAHWSRTFASHGFTPVAFVKLGKVRAKTALLVSWAGGSSVTGVFLNVMRGGLSNKPRRLEFRQAAAPGVERRHAMPQMTACVAPPVLPHKGHYDPQKSVLVVAGMETTASPFPVVVRADSNVPAMFGENGPRAEEKFVEFFTARIRNPNTRSAYLLAVRKFFAWAETSRLSPVVGFARSTSPLTSSC